MTDTERKPIAADESYMTETEAAFIAALGAARADGIVEQSEHRSLTEIAEITGQGAELAHAEQYFEALKDNDNAMDGALSVLSKGSDVGKLAAATFMKLVLDKDGSNEAENVFFTKAVEHLKT